MRPPSTSVVPISTSTTIGGLGLGNTLSVLVLHGCQGMSDEALGMVSLVLPRLEVLDISHCRGVSSTGLMQLVVLRSLRVLRVQGCPHIAEAVVGQVFASMLPSLKLIGEGGRGGGRNGSGGGSGGGSGSDVTRGGGGPGGCGGVGGLTSAESSVVVAPCDGLTADG